METKDIISILAVLLSPVIAIQVEKLIERRRIDKTKKVDIFKTLMASRGAILSLDHVAALNRIDLEFSNDSKFKKVADAWKEYFDLLNTRATTDEDSAVWSARREELLANLLFEMGTSLGYKFDKVLIKRNVYAPIAHANSENELQEIHSYLIKVLKGQSSLLFSQDTDEETTKRNAEYVQQQMELQNSMIEYYKHKNANPRKNKNK